MRLPLLPAGDPRPWALWRCSGGLSPVSNHWTRAGARWAARRYRHEHALAVEETWIVHRITGKEG